jgi:hypothetical protein
MKRAEPARRLAARLGGAPLLSAALLGCGGGGGEPPAPPPAPAPISDAARAAAANSTALSSSNACAAIRPFYWEIGDRSARLGAGSVLASGNLTGYQADTVMPIASASKWLYGAYVVERRAGQPSAQDIEALNFRSGYTSFGFSGCERGDTVGSCATRGDNGLLTPTHVGKFFYNGGHMQVHAARAQPDGLGIAVLDNDGLAAEMRRVLGTELALSYTQPQLAGGARMSASAYALFLRKLLRQELQLGRQLGSHAVCTNPASCASALSTPIRAELDWHYSLGHWVEDDPRQGDGAFSSAGAFGFYPWIDAARRYYGIVARAEASGGGGADSASCGALIRKAWASGAAQ